MTETDDIIEYVLMPKTSNGNYFFTFNTWFELDFKIYLAKEGKNSSIILN